MSELIFLALRVLAAVLLYTFLGWALYLIWKSLKAQTDFLSSKGITAIKLGMISPSGEKHIVEFGQPEFFIGRDPDCALLLDDAAVSARHARFSFHRGHWWLEDYRSKNGTRLNDTHLAMPVILANGDIINCGDTTIEVILPES
jgi:pSer/pThr/pTyr-binding forkhead associated (FHA) protein